MAPPEIIDLPIEAELDVTDDDLLLIYELGVGSDNSKRVERGRFLHDVVRDGGDHDLGTSEITDLTATDATLNNAVITTGLEFDGEATINKVYVANLAIVLANITAGSSSTKTETITGITTADFLAVTMDIVLPDGLIMQAWISAADTVSFKFYNSTAGTITGASYVANTVAIKAS